MVYFGLDVLGEVDVLALVDSNCSFSLVSCSSYLIL